jgi:hypothetical protein
VPEVEAIDWVERSVNFAFDCGATAVSIIPTRTGNGALDGLARATQFSPPTLKTFELAFDRSLALGRGRVFGDLWDLEKFSSCQTCFPARRERLAGINRDQTLKPGVSCSACGCGCGCGCGPHAARRSIQSVTAR